MFLWPTSPGIPYGGAQMGLIENALASFKRHVHEASCTVLPAGRKPKVDASQLGSVLAASYGITASPDQLDHIINCCARNASLRKLDSKEPLSSPPPIASNDPSRRVTFDELMTSAPLWRLIAVSKCCGNIYSLAKPPASEAFVDPT